MEEVDLEIDYPSAAPDVFDFEEIVRTSDLTERCSEEQLEQLRKVLYKHRKVFSNDPGRTHLIEHDIELISETLIRMKPYRTSTSQTEILKKEIKRMLDLKIIEIRESDFSSSMMLLETPGRAPDPVLITGS